MKSLASFFTRGTAEAKADELSTVLAAAEAERQSLREREQALVVSRQAALLTGTDEQLDAMEAELASLQRSAERLDLRIPELRRVRDERRNTEQAQADRATRDAALGERLEIASEIDVKLGEIEALFARLEGTAKVLRGVDHVRLACRKMGGPMMDLLVDTSALRQAMVVQGPHLPKALGIELNGGERPASYREHEDAAWAMALHGRSPAVVRQEVPQSTGEDFDAFQRDRALARRYA